MLRIAICDDIYDARLTLRSALERALERQGIRGRFWEFSSGEGLLRWLERHAGELDLVFLDLEMGELSGMETARRLRGADPGLQLVFVTAYADQVFDGYSVGALGYLLKPPKPEQLDAVLGRARRLCTGNWTGIGPMSAAAGRPSTASPWRRFCILPRTGGRCTASRQSGATPFMESWTRWPRSWAGALSASTSAIWSAPGRWTALTGARRCS